MASREGARFVVVAHFPHAPLSPRMLDGPTDAAAAGRVPADARRMLGARLAEHRRIPDPSPERTLHETAEERGAGLLVVGSSRHGPAGRLVLGTVTAETLRRAPRRVRPPASVRTIHVDLAAERAAGVEPVAADALLEGDVADALAAHSARLDLLVIGSRGLVRAGSVLLGSVAARLVGLARRPVLVLPA